MICKRALLLVVLLGFPQPSGATGKANEIAEFILKKFGKEAVREGAVGLGGRIEILAAKHGPVVYQAVKHAGPCALHLLEQSGEHGKTVAHLLAKFGDEAAILAARPQALALVARHGEDAAVVLIKHKGIAEPILETLGQSGARALAKLNPQNGRRLAILLEEKALAKTGKIDEVGQIVGKFGDRAMTFVWEHKGALAVTSILAAFLSQPEVFINGAKDITKIAGENLARPIAEVPGKVAVEVARGTNWTVVVLVVFVLGCGTYAIHWLRQYRKTEYSKCHE